MLVQARTRTCSLLLCCCCCSCCFWGSAYGSSSARAAAAVMLSSSLPLRRERKGGMAALESMNWEWHCRRWSGRSPICARVCVCVCVRVCVCACVYVCVYAWQKDKWGAGVTQVSHCWRYLCAIVGALGCAPFLRVARILDFPDLWNTQPDHVQRKLQTTAH